MNKSIKKSKALYNPNIIKKTKWDFIPIIILVLAVFFALILITINYLTHAYFIVKTVQCRQL